MKTVLGCIRRADADFALIEDGDRIAVGVSGGKDSLLLLYAMSLYRKFSKKQFDLRAITLDMGLRPFDLSGIAALCEQLQVPYDVVQTHIAHIIFDVRKESNPYLSRTGVTAIRPMVYLPEKHAIHVAKSLQLPVVTNPCPADGHTKREEMKELLKTLSRTYPRLREYMLMALQNTEQYGLWDKKIVGKDGAEG